MQRKKIVVILANYVIVLFACLFYKSGALVEWPVFIVSQILLTILNYAFSKNKNELAFYSVNLVISTIIANELSTRLYYSKVSTDSETLAVGDLGLIVGVVFVLILTLIAVLLKKNKKD